MLRVGYVPVSDFKNIFYGYGEVFLSVEGMCMWIVS
jgi:hypothetical protein